MHWPRDNIFLRKPAIGHGICDTVCKVSANHINIDSTIIRELANIYYILREMNQPSVYHILITLKQVHLPRILDNICSLLAKE